MPYCVIVHGRACFLFLGAVVARRGRRGRQTSGGSKAHGDLQKMEFGKTPEGTPVELYVLTNGRMTVKVMTYGAIITELHVPDRRASRPTSSWASTTSRATWATTLLRRHVGRVANRIAKGKFTLDGKEYKLAANNGPELPARRQEGVRQGASGRPRRTPGPTARRSSSPTSAPTARRATRAS